MATATIPPMSHESLKLILEYVNLDTRVRIRHCIPEIQEIESRTPCHLETFSMGQEPGDGAMYYITVNHRKWIFDSDFVLFTYTDNCYQCELPLPERGTYQALAQKYLISESHIQHFYLADWPEGLLKTDPSFKLFIKEFIFLKTSKYSKLPSFISAGHLKKITMPLDFSTFKLLKDPIFENVEHIHTWFNFRKNLEVGKKVGLLKLLRNKIVSMVNREGASECLLDLFDDWWCPDSRPIGQKFIMENVTMTECKKLIRTFSKEFIIRAPIPDFGDLKVSHAIAFSMNRKKILVAYAPTGKNTFIMEMMKKSGRNSK